MRRDVTAVTITAETFTQSTGTGTTDLNGQVTTTAAGGLSLNTATIHADANVVTNGGPVALHGTALVDSATGTSITTTGDVAGESGGLVDIGASGTGERELGGCGGHHGCGQRCGAAAVRGGEVTIDAADGVIAVGLITSSGGAATGGDNNIGRRSGETLRSTRRRTLIALNGNLTAAGGAKSGTGMQGAGGNVTISDLASLGADLAVSTGATAGDVWFSSTLDGGHSLIVTAGTGNATFSDTIGGTTPLTSLTVTGTDIWR